MQSLYLSLILPKMRLIVIHFHFKECWFPGSDRPGLIFGLLYQRQTTEPVSLPLSPMIRSLNRWSYSLAIVLLRKSRVKQSYFLTEVSELHRKCRRNMTYASAVGLFIRIKYSLKAGTTFPPDLHALGCEWYQRKNTTNNWFHTFYSFYCKERHWRKISVLKYNNT